MLGFLDNTAPSIEAEYTRYLDGDILGKLITKNFLKNRIGYKEDQIYVPVGRYGDSKIKYAKAGTVIHDRGDGSVKTNEGRVTFEIKFARINIANRCLGRTRENWAFANILRTPAKDRKRYDILIAVGLRTRGLEDDCYWKELKKVKAELATEGRRVTLDSRPHDVRFLTLCSFFILPRKKMKTNFFRLHVGAVENSSYKECQAWGDDPARCKAVWKQALKQLQEL